MAGQPSGCTRRKPPITCAPTSSPRFIRTPQKSLAVARIPTHPPTLIKAKEQTAKSSKRPVHGQLDCFTVPNPRHLRILYSPVRPKHRPRRTIREGDPHASWQNEPPPTNHTPSPVAQTTRPKRPNHASGSRSRCVAHTTPRGPLKMFVPFREACTYGVSTLAGRWISILQLTR